jgi:predicted transcriptional regulator
VLEAGEVTGAELERLRPQDATKATAWNNRLKDLNKKRLLQRRKQGREQVYYPVIKEIVVNG